MPGDMEARCATVDENGLPPSDKRRTRLSYRLLFGHLLGITGIKDIVICSRLERTRSSVDALNGLLPLQGKQIAAHRRHRSLCQLRKILDRNKLRSSQMG